MLEAKAKTWEKEILEKDFEKGIEKGIDIGVEKIAINMIKNDEADSKIILYTGLSVERIEQLRARVRNENQQ